jgi:hypothetical protein
MPLDASDRIRRIQEIAVFQGYAIAKQRSQPGVNVSSCATFHTSTINNFITYETKYAIQEGRVYFSTCQGTN